MKFISGLANCHLPGLYSLVIDERKSPEVGMRRVFLAGRTCEMGLWGSDGDWRLKPHNHRQDISLTKLFGGAVTNCVFKTDIHPQWLKGEDDVAWRYVFGSALLDGNFAAARQQREGVSRQGRPLLIGIPQALHWSEVHTVTAEPGSAWMVQEGPLAPPGASRIWSLRRDLKLDSKGLYRPLGMEDLERLERYVNFNASEAAMAVESGGSR